MTNVIGGEFKINISGLTCLQKQQLNLFASGRGAFAAILKSFFNKNNTMQILKGVLLPDYLCSSVTKVCIDNHIPYHFYHIKENFLPDEVELLNLIEQHSAILLISYFGIINVDVIAKKIKEKKQDICVIVDDVQNFYSSNDLSFCDYRFNSYRKWFAVPDGAEVFCKIKNIDIPLNSNSFAQYKFAGNILKNFSKWVDDKICLNLIEKGEQILDSDYLCDCSEISKSLIPLINYEEVKQRRKDNAAFLHSELVKLGIRHIYNSEAVPFFVPVFIDNRAEIRNKMFKNNIFTPIHWPYESGKLSGTRKNRIYDIELSLICDQRYSIKDMEKQIEVLRYVTK